MTEPIKQVLAPENVGPALMTMTATPLPVEMRTRVAQLHAAAERAEITDQASLEKGVDLDRMIQAQIKKGEDARLVLAGPLDKALKAWNGLFKVQRDLLDNPDSLKGKGALGARQIIGRKMSDYKLAEIRREQARQAAEAKAREEQALKDAQEAEAAAQAFKEAAGAAEAHGDLEAADELNQQAEEKKVESELALADAADPLPVASALPSGPVRGDLGGSTTFKLEWQFKGYTDEREVPREYCSPDEKKIKAAIKAGITSIKGCVISEDVARTTR